MNLTQKYINSLVYNDGKPLPEGTAPTRDVRWDNEVRGFGIRVYPSGKKAYIVSYRASGRKRLMTLGTHGVITLEEARKRAKKELTKVIDSRDPLQEKNNAAKGETIRALCTDYIEKHAKPHKKSWETDEKRIARHILPEWASHKIDAINKKDVLALHSRIGDSTPYEANRLAALLSKIFDFAVERGFIDESKPNPAKGIKSFKEEKRDRWLTPEELPVLAEAIDREPNYYARNAIWLYLLTGARKTEILTAKWEHIDWVRNELKLPDTKSGRVHYIPLSAPAVELLKILTRIDDNPYVLPGQVKGQHLINISKPWIRIRKEATIKLWQQSQKHAPIVDEAKKSFTGAYSAAQLYDAALTVAKGKKIELPTGLVDIRVHDLRRTLGSWLAQAGNSLHLIGKVLNHSNQSTTAVYARFGQDSVKQALEDHGERLMIAAGRKKSENVVVLKKSGV